jgi:Xaa-Pro aminopeptidase
MDIVQEKIDQAIAILRELDIDVWMLFVRETGEMADPSYKMIAAGAAVWPSAFIFTRSGERIAIVGSIDVDVFRPSGLYSEVIGYVQGIGADLRRVLERLNPRQIALDYAVSSHAADGLTYGMYLSLQESLKGTPFAGRFISAEEVVARLRGRKSAGEVALIRDAVSVTEGMFGDLGSMLRPGQTERDIAAMLARRTADLGLEPAWDARSCPIVNAGPTAGVAHAGPSAQQLEQGHVLHIDFGVRKNGFCSDLQRMWYLRQPGEQTAPTSVLDGFAAVRRAIEEGAKALKPGAVGWQVDEAGRRCLVSAGYPEFPHALGHQLGRAAHDGGTLLGPRWERYGTTPLGIVEAGQVFTLELSVQTEAGIVGLEEDALVTAHGCELLSTPQTALWYV